MTSEELDRNCEHEASLCARRAKKGNPNFVDEETAAALDELIIWQQRARAIRKIGDEE